MKAYKRKQVKSVKSLEKERQRLKKLSSKIEDEWIDVLQPQSLISSSILPFIFKNKGKKKDNSSTASMLSMLVGINQGHPLWKTIFGILQKEQTKSFAKSVGKSFLRWQAFNLAWWLSGKLYTAVKNKNKPQA